MKLKTVFLIFNALILVSFAFVFLMPVFFLGWDYTKVFWGDNWYLAVLFVAVLVVLNGYFLVNRRLFGALEAEDWPGVIAVAEERVFSRRLFGTGTIRLLVNAYLVTSQIEKIEALETHLREQRPRVVKRNPLLFGVSRLVANDGDRIVKYFSEFRGEQADPWVEWYYAFGAVLQQRTDEAREVLRNLAETSRRQLVVGLALYMLNSAGIGGDVDEKRREFAASTPRARWNRLVSGGESEFHIVVLRKLMDAAADWLYGSSSDSSS